VPATLPTGADSSILFLLYRLICFLKLYIHPALAWNLPFSLNPDTA